MGKIRIPLCTFQTTIPGGNLVTRLTPSALPGTHRTRADVRPAGQPLWHFPQAAGWALRDLRDKHTLPGTPEPLPLPSVSNTPREWRAEAAPDVHRCGLPSQVHTQVSAGAGPAHPGDGGWPLMSTQSCAGDPMAPCSRGPTLLLWFCRLATLSHDVNHRTSPIQGPAGRFQVWVLLT